jgi:hypothetical protein
MQTAIEGITQTMRIKLRPLDWKSEVIAAFLLISQCHWMIAISTFEL